MFCWKTVVLVKIILRFLLGLNRVAKVGAATLFAGHIDDKRVSLESSSREISPIQSKVISFAKLQLDELFNIKLRC
jgi:hypothetical protein